MAVFTAQTSPDLNLTPLAAFLRFLPSAALGKNVKKQQEVSDLNQDYAQTNLVVWMMAPLQLRDLWLHHLEIY